MIFYENRLLADDSHVISYLIFFQKLGKMSQNLPSAAVVIGALRVKTYGTQNNHNENSIKYQYKILINKTCASRPNN